MKSESPIRHKRLLRLKQAGEYLGISEWKLRAIVQAGDIPIVQYGHNAPWLMDLKDLDGWIERHKQTL